MQIPHIPRVDRISTGSKSAGARVLTLRWWSLQREVLVLSSIHIQLTGRSHRIWYDVIWRGFVDVADFVPTGTADRFTHPADTQRRRNVITRDIIFLQRVLLQLTSQGNPNPFATHHGATCSPCQPRSPPPPVGEKFQAPASMVFAHHSSPLLASFYSFCCTL